MAFEQHLNTMASRMPTSSAMNPALTLCLMICPISFISAASLFHFHQSWAALLFIAIGLLPVLITSWQLIHFTKKDPDRLQRDQHVENMLAIQNYIAVKDGDVLRELPISSRLSSNPLIEGQPSE